MSKQNVYIVFGIIFSLIIIFLSLILAVSRTSWFGYAKEPSQTGSISLDNSYMFASPISALADGSGIIRVTVFILSDKGLGVAGKTVELKSNIAGLNITKVQEVTDTIGRAIFDVASKIQGDYKLSADISDALLPQTVSVSFR